MKGIERAKKLDGIRIAGSKGNVYGIEKMLLSLLLAGLGNPPIRIVLWNGEEIAPAGKKPAASLVIRSRKSLFRLLINPALNFGDDYTNGSIDVEGNLIHFCEAVYGKTDHESSFRTVMDYLNKIQNRPRKNSLKGSRENIHHHYDLGNNFYKLWLDDNMQYTCAYFPTPVATIEEAQIAKMHHVCRKLRLKPGETVVEAGCGWGTLAIFMAKYYRVKVKAYNISREQLAFAYNLARQKELTDQVEFIEDDFRNISGAFDAFVSVGMLEHVGKKNYATMGNVIKGCLKEGGRGLIHSIGRNKAEPMNAWTEKRIFPGAYPPTLREIMTILEPWGLAVIDVENLRLHYAKTLLHWLEKFDKNTGEIEETYSPEFIRAWRLYLSGSVAAFTSGWLQLFQVLFAEPSKNDVPWTRAHLYK